VLAPYSAGSAPLQRGVGVCGESPICIAAAAMLKAVVLGRLPTCDEGVESTLVMFGSTCTEQVIFDDREQRNAKHMLVGGASGFSDARQIPATLLMRIVNKDRVCAQQPTGSGSHIGLEHVEAVHAAKI